MTFHVISVGTSIDDKIQARFGNHFDKKVAGRRVAGLDLLRETLRCTDPDRWLSKGATDVLAKLESTDSAELSTFAAQNRLGVDLDKSDTAFLLASDTEMGLQSAVWNAYCLAGGDTSRLRYFDETSPDVAQGALGEIAILRIPGLDARYQAAFEDSMETLGLVGTKVLMLNRSPQQPVKIHLSGGYKASVPFLIALAEGLRASLPDVSALCLYEGGITAGTKVTPIAIPLRHLDLAEIGNLARFLPDKTARNVKNPSVPLTGYTHAVDVADPQRRWALTPFGRGLVEMYLTRQEMERFG